MTRHRHRQPGIADGEMQHGGTDGAGEFAVPGGGGNQIAPLPAASYNDMTKLVI